MSEYVCGTDGHEDHWFTGEEIIRCRDCKHYEISELGQGFCIWENYTDWECEPDGFCAWAERRTELPSTSTLAEMMEDWLMSLRFAQKKNIDEVHAKLEGWNERGV